MKGTRAVVLLIGIVVGLVVIWQFMPGVRQKARDAYHTYGGWTEDARRADPVGFIEYAEQKLRDDLAQLESSRTNLARLQETIGEKRSETLELMASADTLAEGFRDAYRGADAADAWPVNVSGKSYTREQLREQVALILLQRRNYEQLVAELDGAGEAIKTNVQKVVAQTAATKATLEILPAKREIARVQELTKDIESTLGKVDALMGENDDVLTGSPVRTVEELVRARTQAADADASIDAQVDAFLEGER